MVTVKLERLLQNGDCRVSEFGCCQREMGIGPPGWSLEIEMESIGGHLVWKRPDQPILNSFLWREQKGRRDYTSVEKHRPSS